MFDITCIGGITYDIFFKSHFNKQEEKLVIPWGDKTVVENMDVALGGGGANAAVGFSRLGLNTTLLARVGTGHISESVESRLKKEKVDITNLIKDPHSHTATSVIMLDENSGERTIVMYRGKNDVFESNEVDFEKLLNTKWLYIADLASSSDKNEFVQTLVNKAADKNIPTVFTPSKRQLQYGLIALSDILKNVSVMILNAREWEELTNCMPYKKAVSLGPEIVVITGDKHGVAACVEENECIFHPAPRIDKIIDTTGAGDAFAVGFVAALEKEKTVNEALEWGTKNAGSVISQLGAQAGLLGISNMRR